ncbi:hypothetical protein BGX21_003818 [Mortierella sp. AD011]|nr:hypothetical protein BGX21_003818 [Mortierella sp. AD011]
MAYSFSWRLGNTGNGSYQYSPVGVEEDFDVGGLEVFSDSNVILPQYNIWSSEERPTCVQKKKRIDPKKKRTDPKKKEIDPKGKTVDHKKKTEEKG